MRRPSGTSAFVDDAVLARDGVSLGGAVASMATT
jgi:hypothetical protein